MRTGAAIHRTPADSAQNYAGAAISLVVLGGDVVLLVPGGGAGGGLERFEKAAVKGPADRDADADEGDGHFGV